MLDNEVKTILQEQFSKERNYQKVMYNMNKSCNRNKYIKIIKYALLPTCAILFVTILITNYSNNNDKYKDVAYVNSIMIGKDNNTNDDNKNITNERKYYKVQGSYESSWAVDPTDLKEVINFFNNESRQYLSIVRVKIKEVQDAKFLPKMQNYYNPWNPKTPLKVELLEVLKGKNIISENIYFKNNTIYISGGDILLADLEKQVDKDEADKMGITNLPINIKNSQYMRYWNDYYFTPEVGKEYIMLVGPLDDGIYSITDAGYGVFTSKVENGEEIITNVISNKQFKLKEVLEY